jgi:hypothetical protein
MGRTIQMHTHSEINDQIEGVTKRASTSKPSDAYSKMQEREQTVNRSISLPSHSREEDPYLLQTYDGEE